MGERKKFLSKSNFAKLLERKRDLHEQPIVHRRTKRYKLDKKDEDKRGNNKKERGILNDQISVGCETCERRRSESGFRLREER